MTELEWCRENAPDALKSMSDEMLLQYMHETYVKFCSDKESVVSCDSADLPKNNTNDYLDYMVLELSRRFGNKLAFKGGYMLTKLMSSRARQTTDIDFSILTDEIYSEIKNALSEIGEHFISEGIIDRYAVKETIQPTMSGGMDFYKDGAKILGVDVGWHDITYGTTITKIDVAELNAFTVERMLADKITAILSRKRFRRPKDIYDLYCISECLNFDAHKVSDYILRRTEGVGADWRNYPFSDDVLREYEKAYNTLRLDSIYVGQSLPRPVFRLVYERFCIIAECVRDYSLNHLWDCKVGYFK